MIDHQRGGIVDSIDVSHPPTEEVNYGPSNLPPNIDIIAEATLVEDHRNNSNNYHHGGGSGEDDNDDVDTLGLHWDEAPSLGGAQDDSASVAVSAITAPTVLINRGNRSAMSTTEDGSSSPQHPLEVSEQSPRLADEETGNNCTAPTTTATACIVVHATPVRDDPFSFLETKSGKVAMVVAFNSMIMTLGLLGG